MQQHAFSRPENDLHCFQLREEKKRRKKLQAK